MYQNVKQKLLRRVRTHSDPGRAIVKQVARILRVGLVVGLFVSALQAGVARAQSRDQIAPGDLRLTATFKSIGVELLFTGDDDANATAALDFRPAGDTDWRSGLPLWRTDDGSKSPGRAFYGSALMLDPGVTYEIRIALADPDGVAGNSTLTGEIETRPDDLAGIDTLAPNFYVAPDGNDAAEGTTPDSSWRTLDKALVAAPPGATVEVAPGHYASPGPRTVRSAPLTLKARNPAVVTQTQVIGGQQRRTATDANQGARSVVEPRGSDGSPAVSAPNGAQDADLVGLPLNRVAPWQQVTFSGVVDPTQTYTVWKWAGAPTSTATEASVSSTRDGQPNRVVNWYSGAPAVDTPQKWAEQVFTYPDWHSGFWAGGGEQRHFTDENGQDAVTNDRDVYLRLPGDINPNDAYVTLSGRNMVGLAVDGPDVRIDGLEVRTIQTGIQLGPHATRAVVEACLVEIGGGGLGAVGQKAKQGAPSTYGSDHLIQNNIFRDSGVTSADPTNPGVPWFFIKSHPDRLGRSSETVGIGGTGGAQRMVIRWNTFDGSFDGFGGYHADFDRYSMQDADIYGNLFRGMGDDGLDLSRGTINNRIWDNRFEQLLDVLSLAAPTWGPVYFFRNEAWRFGNQLEGRTADGRVPGGSAIKYGAVSYRNQPAARAYIVQNTFWSDQTPAEGLVRWGEAGREQPWLFLRDNIVRVTDKAAHIDAPGRWDEDADDFSSSGNQSAIVQTPSGRFRADVDGYRANLGQGAHTNTRASFGEVVDADLVDPANGDLRLKPESVLVGHGLPVANIADRPGVGFEGAAPDVGAADVSY